LVKRETKQKGGRGGGRGLPKSSQSGQQESGTAKELSVGHPEEVEGRSEAASGMDWGDQVRGGQKEKETWREQAEKEKALPSLTYFNHKDLPGIKSQKENSPSGKKKGHGRQGGFGLHIIYGAKGE